MDGFPVHSGDVLNRVGAVMAIAFGDSDLGDREGRLQSGLVKVLVDNTGVLSNGFEADNTINLSGESGRFEFDRAKLAETEGNVSLNGVGGLEDTGGSLAVDLWVLKPNGFHFLAVDEFLRDEGSAGASVDEEGDFLSFELAGHVEFDTADQH